MWFCSKKECRESILQHLILFLCLQEAISNHNEPVTGSYGMIDAGSRYSYSQLGSTPYSASSFSSQSYGGYGSSGLGGYSTFRLWRVKEEFVLGLISFQVKNVYSHHKWFLLCSCNTTRYDLRVIFLVAKLGKRDSICNEIVVILSIFLKFYFLIYVLFSIVTWFNCLSNTFLRARDRHIKIKI